MGSVKSRILSTPRDIEVPVSIIVAALNEEEAVETVFNILLECLKEYPDILGFCVGENCADLD